MKKHAHKWTHIQWVMTYVFKICILSFLLHIITAVSVARPNLASILNENPDIAQVWLVFLGGTPDHPAWSVMPVNEPEFMFPGDVSTLSSLSVVIADAFDWAYLSAPLSVTSKLSENQKLINLHTEIPCTLSVLNKWISLLQKTAKDSSLQCCVQIPLDVAISRPYIVPFVEREFAISIESRPEFMHLLISLSNALVRSRRNIDNAPFEKLGISGIGTSSVVELASNASIAEIEERWLNIILKPLFVPVKSVNINRSAGYIAIYMTKEYSFDETARLLSGARSGTAFVEEKTKANQGQALTNDIIPKILQSGR